MKYTGIAVAIIGVGIMLFSLFGGLAPSAQDTTGAGEASSTRTADVLLPTLFGLVAIGIGACLYLFGGKGVVSAPSPAVRN